MREQHLLQVQTLFVQHMPKVRAFVLSLMPDLSQVDDIVQETFLTVTAKAPDFKLGTNFNAWVMVIARFQVLKFMNRMERDFLPLAPEVIEALAVDAPALEEERDRLLVFLDECLKKLAPRASRIVEARYFQVRKPAEIARRLGLSVNGVSVTLARSRVQLRECIEMKLRGEEGN